MAVHKFPPKEDVLLLNVLVEWADEHGIENMLDTRSASDLLLDRLRQSGEPFSMVRSKPWFGLETSIRTLSGMELVEVDFGMAHFVAPGSPTPEPKRYFVRVSAKGQELIANLSN